MKKVLAIFTILVMTLGIFTFTNTVYAETTKAIDNKTESQLVEIKETQTKSLEDYKQKYGSDAYGTVAYILNIVRIYSIPFCFLGIVISVLYKVIIGTRNLENAEKGLGMSIAIITITIICQVLPLIFALVIKLGKE